MQTLPEMNEATTRVAEQPMCSTTGHSQYRHPERQNLYRSMMPWQRPLWPQYDLVLYKATIIGILLITNHMSRLDWCKFWIISESDLTTIYHCSLYLLCRQTFCACPPSRAIITAFHVRQLLHCVYLLSTAILKSMRYALRVTK